MSCECLDPICLKVGVNPCESTKLPINLEYGNYILEFGFGGSSMNIEIEVNEEYPNVVIASGRLNEDMTYILRVWDKDANEYLPECYQLTTFLVRGVSNNGGSDPSPTPTPSDLDNLEFTTLTATPDYDNNEITISATIIDNEGVPQTQSATVQVPLHIASLSDAERISQSNGQWMEFIDNAGVSHQIIIEQPYPRISMDDDIVDEAVSPDKVGRIYLWERQGWFVLVDYSPSSLPDVLYYSSNTPGYWWLAMDNSGWINSLDANITNELANRWKIASGTHSNNTIPKVTATGELGSSNISDSGTIVTIGGNGLTIPNTTTTGATTNGLIKYNTTANEYRGVRSGVELKFLQTGDVTMSRFVWVNSATGTDTRTGLSKYSADVPFKTLTAACAAATASTDTIIATGTFAESFTFNGGSIIFNRGTLTGNISYAKNICFYNYSKWIGLHILTSSVSNIDGVIEGDKTSEWELTANLAYTFSSQPNIKRIRGFRRIYGSTGGTFSLFSAVGSIADATLLTRFKQIPYLIVEDVDIIECYNLCASALIGFRNIKHIICSNWVVSSSAVGVFKFDNVSSIEAVRVAETFNARGVYFLFNHTKVYTSGTGTAYMFAVGAGYTGYFYIFAYNSHFETASDRIANHPTANLNSDTDFRTRVHMLNCSLKVGGPYLFGNSATTPMHELSLVGCFGNVALGDVTDNPATSQEVVDYQQFTLLRTDVF